jgi:hypothetical protein
VHHTAQVLAQRALGERSAFSAYLQTLPAKLPHIPLFCSAEGKEILSQYAPVSEQVRGLRIETVMYVPRRPRCQRPWSCIPMKTLLACTLVQVNERCRFALSFSQDHLARADVASEVFHGQQVDSDSFGASPRVACTRSRSPQACGCEPYHCLRRGVSCAYCVHPDPEPRGFGKEMLKHASMPAWAQHVHAQYTA